MLLHEDWMVISPEGSYRPKLMQMAKAFLRLRMTNTDEKTYSYGVCTASITDAPLEASVQLARIEILKEFVRCASSKVVKGPKDYISLEHLCEHEAELYNETFPSPPAVCPLDEITLRVATGTLPCRKPKGTEVTIANMICLQRQLTTTMAAIAYGKQHELKDEAMP